MFASALTALLGAGWLVWGALAALTLVLSVPVAVWLLRAVGFECLRDPITYRSFLKQRSELPDPPKGTPRVAIVGAGFSGLAAAGALTRHKVPFEVFDEDPDGVGGNWRHGVYPTAHIISSKLTTEFKDVPMPADYPDFPSADQMRRYLEGYAEHWGIGKHLHLGVKVESVLPAARSPTAEDDGGVPPAVPEEEVAADPQARRGDHGWVLVLRPVAGGPTFRRHFGALIVANGHHWDRRMCKYPGQDKFAGEVIHSKDYKGPEVLEGKRVLVVGGGNSACDISVEAGRFGRDIHISQRRGYWITPRLMFGVPTVELLYGWMPLFLQRIFVGGLLRLFVGKYRQFGLQEPDHKMFERHPTINSDLLEYLRKGIITPHTDIDKFTGGHRIVFKDGTAGDFDLVVSATGYHVSLPLLGDLVTWGDKEEVPNDGEASRPFPDLVQGIFSPRHRNLYVLGLGQPRFGAGPLLTAAADALSKVIIAQVTMELPFGELMARLGYGPLTSYLMDPHDAFNKALQLGSSISRLQRLERRMRT